MTTATIKTPADLTITPRDRRFGRNTAQQRWWAGGDPFATAFYNALSVTFPRGEAMFIESVRAFRDGVPPKLEKDIRAFVTQEVIHTREHVAFNSRVEDAGYDITFLNHQVDHVMDLIKSRPPIVNLCVTMALEHYTAILAKQFLEDPNAFAKGEGIRSTCGNGMLSKKSSIRASPMTLGSMPRAIGAGSSAGGSSRC